MDPNRFEFTLTNRDMAEAFAGARRRLLKAFLQWKIAVPFGLFIALVVASVFWSDWLTSSNLPESDPTTQASSFSDIWVPFLPSAIIVAAGCIIIFWVLRAQHHNHSLVGRPHTLIVDADKITWTAAFSRLEYHWQAFYGFKETKNLFLLYLSDAKWAEGLMFHLVPKRAFTSPEQIAEFRRLLETNIHARVSRIPVIQPSAATPITDDQKSIP